MDEYETDTLYESSLLDGARSPRINALFRRLFFMRRSEIDFLLGTSTEGSNGNKSSVFLFICRRRFCAIVVSSDYTRRFLQILRNFQGNVLKLIHLYECKEKETIEMHEK